MKKNLIAYFSCSGVTRQAAQRLAEVTGGELFEIQPEVPYTAADLNWRDAQSRSTQEMKDLQCRPSMAKQPDLQDVDVVFVGFPVWWYTAPSIVRTFLESADFSGKTVVPFCTSGGSGTGKIDHELPQSCSDQTHWRSCRLVNGMSQAELKEWVDSLAL